MIHMLAVLLATQDASIATSRSIVLFKSVSVPENLSLEPMHARSELERVAHERRVDAENRVAETLQRASIQIQPDHVYSGTVEGFSGQLTEKQVEVLRTDPNIEGVYEDYIGGWIAEASNQPVTAGSLGSHFVDRGVSFAAGPRLVSSSNSKFIWVIDSGIDLDHPDLNVVTSAPYATSFTTSTPDDDFGHGSLVAGIAAARYNSTGTSGVAAGAKVVPVKIGQEFFNGYGFLMSNLLAALSHVDQFNMAGDVVNLSLYSLELDACQNQTTGLGAAVRQAIQNLGYENTWVIVGAGNLSSCTAADEGLPACVNGYRILTVGNTILSTQGLPLCQAAHSMGNSVDWLAVGNQTSTYKNGGYAIANGSSMSAATVSGIAFFLDAQPFVGRSPPSCCGRTVSSAHTSNLASARFDLTLELHRLVVSNVADWDGTEDLFGQLRFELYRAGDTNVATTDIALWNRTQANHLSLSNGTHTIAATATIATNLNLYQILGGQLTVGGELRDDEGIYPPKSFVCTNCTQTSSRKIEFPRLPTLTASLLRLVNNGQTQIPSFSTTTDYFTTVFAENGNPSNGQVSVRWRLRITPHI